MLVVTTPNINHLLALPFKKQAVQSREKFCGIWTSKKEYVRSVSGGGGAYQVNKEKRRSEEFEWPKSPHSQTGEQKTKKVLINI